VFLYEATLAEILKFPSALFAAKIAKFIKTVTQKLVVAKIAKRNTLQAEFILKKLLKRFVKSELNISRKKLEKQRGNAVLEKK
jgi:hypothetical protein